MARRDGVELYEDFADTWWQGRHDLGPSNGCVMFHTGIIQRFATISAEN